MKIDEIKTVVELMSKHDLSEFKIEAEEMHLCIRRGSTAQTIQVAAPLASMPVAVAPMQQAPAVAVSEEAAPKNDVENGEEERLMGSVSINNQVYDSVGIRYKGNSMDFPCFFYAYGY
jgi:acetyl-CoA carboxylase biotin carboxyl carrier protein